MNWVTTKRTTANTRNGEWWRSKGFMAELEREKGVSMKERVRLKEKVRLKRKRVLE